MHNPHTVKTAEASFPFSFCSGCTTLSGLGGDGIEARTSGVWEEIGVVVGMLSGTFCSGVAYCG